MGKLLADQHIIDQIDEDNMHCSCTAYLSGAVKLEGGMMKAAQLRSQRERIVVVVLCSLFLSFSIRYLRILTLSVVLARLEI